MLDSFTENISKAVYLTPDISLLSVAIRIALAVVLSSVIGCERASKRHSAGLRTFILASFSSAIAMILDLFLMNNTVVRIPIYWVYLYSAARPYFLLQETRSRGLRLRSHSGLADLWGLVQVPGFTW